MINNLPLVSIITPCYNGEKWIGRLLDSVLSQSYEYIEMIIVNDGSTDNSEHIILSYKNSFEKRGYRFIYAHQENKGLGGAINMGLTLFSGDYLCWPDADDYLTNDSVQKKVDFLEEHPDIGVVTSNAYVRNANDLEDVHLLIAEDQKYVYDDNQFLHLLTGRGPFCPGCHMMRTSMFLDVNPTKHIYPARRGQNWQLLLPMYYKYKRGYINLPLYNYIDNPGSMSKDQDSLASVMFRYNEHFDILMNTLCMIEDIQRVNLNEEKHLVENKTNHDILRAATYYKDKTVFFETFARLNPEDITKEDKVNYWFMKNVFFRFAIKVLRKINMYKS